MDKKYKILIADDEQSIHKLLSRGFSTDEFETIHAYDGKETTELICQDIKKNPKTKDIKVLMLSAKDEQRDRIIGLELGADDYETKPFNLNHLVVKIRAMCRKV